MKKNSKMKIVASAKHMTTTKLEAIKNQLTEWTANHEKCKASYWWTPASSASSRRAEERRKSFTETVSIGDVTITYESDCNCSCKHFYWHDGLQLDGMDEKISFADISFLQTAIDDILVTRANKKSSAAKRTPETQCGQGES